MAARLKTDLHIRVMSAEMRSWRKAAKREGTTLSAWIRARLNLSATPAASGEVPAISENPAKFPLAGAQ